MKEGSRITCIHLELAMARSGDRCHATSTRLGHHGPPR
jgi:hypothetical protein